MRATAAAFLLVIAGCGSSDVGSIGAVLGRSNDDHALYVRDVPEGLAADQAGLLPGDEIVMIDGTYVRTLSAEELQAKLRGDIGSHVSLTVSRGELVVRVDVTRTALSAAPLRVRPKEQKLDE